MSTERGRGARVLQTALDLMALRTLESMDLRHACAIAARLEQLFRAKRRA